MKYKIFNIGITEHFVLKDTIHILAKDFAQNVCLWDIRIGSVIQDYGVIDFKEKKNELSKFISLPKWYSSDNRLGLITITLRYPTCFNAEFYASDFEIDVPEDKRINYGECVLRGIFDKWIESKNINIKTEFNLLWSNKWVDSENKKIRFFKYLEQKQANGILII